MSKKRKDLREDLILDWSIRDRFGGKVMYGTGDLSKELGFITKKFNLEDNLEFISSLRILESDR